MDRMQLARKIAQRRNELGLTIAEVEARLPVQIGEPARWEMGTATPDESIMAPLAEILQLDLLELLGEALGDIAQSGNIRNNTVTDELASLLTETLTLEVDEPSGEVSPLLFGCNLEHTRSCVYTGLSAQKLRNRKFVGKPSACSGHAMQWYPIGERPIFVFDKPYTRHHELYHMKRSHECNSQRIVNAYEGSLCGIGQHELFLNKDEKCHFRLVARTSDPVVITVALTSRHGRDIYDQVQLSVAGDQWSVYEADLTSPVRDEDGDIRLTFTGKASVCLGAVSLVPCSAFRGMRRDVIEHLKEVGIRMLRWPGGNFAGEYNWLDGLLPVDMRAPFESFLGIETQPHSMGYDFHEINSDDFIALCREVGAEPYITINPCWNTPEENAAWVEYMNGDASTPYGRLRAENGSPEPYHVRFWSLGNEFGYGHMEGDNTPQGYCRLALANGHRMLAVSPDLELCTSGPYPNRKWAEESVIPLREVAHLVSQHYYSHNPDYPDAEHFDEEYYACLSGVKYLQAQIHENRDALPDDVGISMDEWNVWYAWYRPSNVTDGIFTALNFHMLLSEAEPSGIRLACHFEAINEGILCVTPETSFLTAQGQVFTFMKHHAGGRILHRGLDAFATEKDGMVTVTVVNASYDGKKTVALSGCGKCVEGRLLRAETVLPPSFFELVSVMPEDGAIEMPPHSVIMLKFQK